MGLQHLCVHLLRHDAGLLWRGPQWGPRGAAVHVMTTACEPHRIPAACHQQLQSTHGSCGHAAGLHSLCIAAAAVGMRMVSIMACLAQDLNKESKRIARYRARMEQVDKWMSRRHLPKSLRSRIGHHYQEVSLSLISRLCLKSSIHW